MKLSTLLARTIPATADLYGETLNMQVRPSKWTTALLNSPGTIAEAMVEVVESWDLEDDGQPVPITVEAIESQIGLPIQRLIWRGIAGAFDPNLTETPKTSTTG